MAILVVQSKVSVSSAMVWILLGMSRPPMNWVIRSLSDFPIFVPFSNTLLANSWEFSWGICLKDRKEASLDQSRPKGLNLKRKAQNIFFNI